jgi:hypothetical protein
MPRTTKEIVERLMEMVGAETIDLEDEDKLEVLEEFHDSVELLIDQTRNELAGLEDEEDEEDEYDDSEIEEDDDED